MKQRLLFFLLEGKDAVWMIWKDMVDKNEMASPYVNEMAQNIEGEELEMCVPGKNVLLGEIGSDLIRRT